ncbi:HMG (high mobility group) box domain-containing protein [Sarocladium implicatum]|nr:HMG (high mobility group) box domain-containing protein [Sarocladium implicatum]
MAPLQLPQPVVTTSDPWEVFDAKAQQQVTVLSIYARAHNIPVDDVNEYVSRNPEQRRIDKEEKGKGGGGRACNAFILYRHCYQKVAARLKGEVKQNNISTVVGDSWRNEVPEISQKFKDAFKMEKQRHADAFGVVKYNPARPGTKGAKKTKSGARVVSGRIAKPSRARRPATSTLDSLNRFSTRSPEPQYFLTDRPPSGEIPLLSYQGTPLTSSVSTPTADEVFYQNSLNAAMDSFGSAQYLPSGFSGHVPYGNQILVQQPQMYQSYAAIRHSNPTYDSGPDASAESYSSYPPPPQASQDPYGFAGANQQDHLGMANMAQPRPVLRHMDADHTACMDPQMLLNGPVPVDPSLEHNFAQEQFDMMQNLCGETQPFATEGIPDDYLGSNSWEAESPGF